MSLVDGGVTINNPAKSVYDYVLTNNKVKHDQILLLSLGCGYLDYQADETA